MNLLVSALVWLRRKARQSLSVAGLVLLAAVVVLDAVHPLNTALFVPFAGLLVALIILRGWQRTHSVDQKAGLDVELGSLLCLAAYATVVHFDGSVGGHLYPLVFVAIGIISALGHPVASLIVIGLAMGFETGLCALAFDGSCWTGLLAHLAFAVVFGLVNMLSLRLEVTRLRRASHSQLQAERDRVREEALSYRLLRAPSDATGEDAAQAEQAEHYRRDEERLLLSGVDQIHKSVLLGLQLLRESLSVHTAMLLWLDDSGTSLRITELVSDDAELSEGPFAAGDGIFGVVLNQRAPVCVYDVKPRFALPYYLGTYPVQAVCAVPVIEHGALRGVLVVDRKKGRAFGLQEQALVEQAGRFVARTIQNERVFVQLERTKVEQGKLYRAADALGAAISEQDVVEAGVNSAREIASVDFAAFTLFDDDEQTHQIRAVSGDGAEALAGQRFRHNSGLVSMVVRNRHPLPYRGQYDSTHQLVFAKGLQPPAMPSLVVLPLIVHDRPLGTLVLGSRQNGAFNDVARGLLEVLSSHMAVSLANARMVRRLEEQATTDGMTGLLNKRAMLETAEQKILAARRFGRRLSVLITDIDHFKRVNDTYGHDVGDVVIKELAGIHDRVKRTTDAVARFGGEEFVVICEETDAEGAFLLAERIRAEFARTTFHGNGEPINCTCSVGIATYPQAGENWDELFKAADAALYVSKRSGRDRTTIWGATARGHVAA